MNKEKDQLAFYFNSAVCSGCKTCQVACKDKNDLPLGILWRRVYEISGGGWEKEGNCFVPKLSPYFLSMRCNLCQDPLCLSSCPTSAIQKRADGIVFIDHNRCMGCRYCEWACPYGAPQFMEDIGKMTKCDFCMDEIDKGNKPACVAACPMRALDFGKISDLEKKYGKNNIFPLPDPEICAPSAVITPHADSKKKHENMTIENKEEIYHA